MFRALVHFCFFVSRWCRTGVSLVISPIYSWLLYLTSTGLRRKSLFETSSSSGCPIGKPHFNTCRLACQTYHWKPLVKLWNWTFPGIKLPWCLDVRHSEEEAVLSFVITKSLISLDPFFMMVMLNRFHFFLKLTVLRDNYWIQRFDPQKGGQYGLRRLYGSTGSQV